MAQLEIDRYDFFGADVSAIHGPLTDIPKIFKSCFLLHYQKYKCILWSQPNRPLLKMLATAVKL